ncbi:MAG: hypothetical protein ACRC46_10580 [Thermoguttaceae bacterium]
MKTLSCLFVVVVSAAVFGNGLALGVEPIDYGPDPMRYLENDRVKLGIDLSIGGAVTFLSDRENGGENMINSADWGRQIQLSYYSGPRPFIGPNGEKPTDNWAGLGWNPIQSGDVGGNKSPTVAFSRPTPQSMRVRCVPMQWPHKTGLCGDCQFDVVYTLDGNVFHIDATIVVDRPDKTQYDACGQEQPALYTNGAWYKLVSYLGTEPFKGEPVTVVVDKADGKGWPWVHFYTPERWCALVDDKGLGIGVYQPESVKVTAGFHGGDKNKGFGGPQSGQTGYIAPLGHEILDHNITLDYHTTFILGTVDQIRSYVVEREKSRCLPNWVFATDRQSWYYQAGASDTGWPISDKLAVTFPARGRLVGPDTFWSSDDATTLEIEGAFTGGNEFIAFINPFSPADTTDWLGWSEGTQNKEKEQEAKRDRFPSLPAVAVPFTVTADGVNRVYRIDLRQATAYRGAMKNILIHAKEPGTAEVRRITLCKP